MTYQTVKYLTTEALADLVISLTFTDINSELSYYTK